MCVFVCPSDMYALPCRKHGVETESTLYKMCGQGSSRTYCFGYVIRVRLKDPLDDSTRVLKVTPSVRLERVEQPCDDQLAFGLQEQVHRPHGGQ